MSARVTGANSSQAPLGEIARHFFVAQQRAQMAFHAGAVFCHEKIAAWLEKIFGVTPGRTDERNSASESFEWTNSGNTRESIYVRTTRHMQRYPETREDFRHTVIGQPAAVGDSRIAQHAERSLRVADAEYLRAQPKAFNRFNQELL